MRLADYDLGGKNIEMSPIYSYLGCCLLGLSPNLKSNFRIVKMEFTLSQLV